MQLSCSITSIIQFFFSYSFYEYIYAKHIISWHLMCSRLWSCWCTYTLHRTRTVATPFDRSIFFCLLFTLPRKTHSFLFKVKDLTFFFISLCECVREGGMGRIPCCDKNGMKKGPWTPEEDEKLIEFIKKNGHGSWRSLPKLAGFFTTLFFLF